MFQNIEQFGCIKKINGTGGPRYSRGLGIRGFDYPRTVKWAKIADNEGNLRYSYIIRAKMMDLVSEGRNFPGT